MSKVFIVTGESYHNNKDQFKALLKEHKIKWAGTFETPKWASKEVTVSVTFIRDEEKNITIEGQFVVEGTGQSFNDICKYIADVLKGAVNTDKSKSIKDDILSEQLKIFDMVHKPNIEILKRKKAPQSYIKFVTQEYEKDREKLIKELSDDGTEEE